MRSCPRRRCDAAFSSVTLTDRVNHKHAVRDRGEHRFQLIRPLGSVPCKFLDALAGTYTLGHIAHEQK